MNYKKIIPAILFILFSLESYSQTFQQTYGGINDDYAWDIKVTKNGDFIIAGQTASFGAGGMDALLIKTKSDGTVLWSKTYGGSGDDLVRAVELTYDGGYIMVGTTSSFGAGGNDIYVVKTDSNGVAQWTKAFGGSGNEHAWSVAQTSDSGYVISGYGNSFGQGADDSYMLKIDVKGNLVWAHSYGGTGGNGGNEAAECVKVTADGKFIMAGYTSTFSQAVSNAYIVKTDTGGNILWTKVINGSWFQWAYKIRGTRDGGFIFAGVTQALGAGGADMFLFKTDSAGNLQWTKTFGGTADDGASDIQQTTDGGFILSGYTNSFGNGGEDVFLVKTDSLGNEQWAKTFGGAADDGSPASIGSASGAVRQTTDGGYIIAAGTQSFGAGGWDFYLIKTDSGGTSNCNETNPVISVSSPNPTVGSGGFLGSGGTLSAITVSSSSVITTDSILCIQPPPCNSFSVSISDSPTTCGNSTGQAMANPAGGTNPYNFAWSTIPVQTTQQIQGLAAGNYAVTVTDAHNCTASGTTTINSLGGNFTASVSISASATTICPGSQVDFSAVAVNGGSAPSYQWKVNSINTGANDSAFSTSGLKNNDTIICIITSNANCVIGSPASSNAIIMVVGASINAGTVTAVRDTICNGESGSLTLNNSSGGNIQWQSSFANTDFTNITGANDTIYKTNSLQQTTYYRVIVSNGICEDSSSSLQLYVPPPLNASFTFTASGKQVLFNSNGSTGNIVSYFWNFGDNQTSTGKNPTHTYSKDTVYNVCLSIYDGSNCSFTFCQDILLTGIATIPAQGKWDIYPNPFSNQLYIESKTANIKTEGIEIYDVLGRIVLSRQDIYAANTTLQLNVSSLAAGLYYLKIITPAINFVQLVIKQ